jgi:hypothetical protein
LARGAAQNARIVISTDEQLSAFSLDIRKRAVGCLIDAAIRDRHSCSIGLMRE